MRNLNTKEAARRLGRSERGVRKMAEHGRIKAERVGRDWVIPESSLDHLLPRAEQN